MAQQTHVGEEPDLELWDRVSTGYRSRSGILDAAGSNARTEEARQAARAEGAGHETVDLYVDPVCPYTWLASRWLQEVEKHREIRVRYHVMSLAMLNENRQVDERYRASLENARPVARVATAVAVHHGPDALRTWYCAFGAEIFDHWRLPDLAEYRQVCSHALDATGLPGDLVTAGEEYDDALRLSHDRGTRPVGVEAGTPVIHFRGTAFFGPVLNAVLTEAEAVRVFDGVSLLTGCPDFYELKRTRTSPPVLR